MEAETKVIKSTAKEVESANKADGNIMVKPNEPVTVKWAKGSKYHTEGTTSVVHRLQAEKLVKAGKAAIVKGE